MEWILVSSIRECTNSFLFYEKSNLSKHSYQLINILFISIKKKNKRPINQIFSENLSHCCLLSVNSLLRIFVFNFISFFLASPIGLFAFLSFIIACFFCSCFGGVFLWRCPGDVYLLNFYNQIFLFFYLFIYSFLVSYWIIYIYFLTICLLITFARFGPQTRTSLRIEPAFSGVQLLCAPPQLL